MSIGLDEFFKSTLYRLYSVITEFFYAVKMCFKSNTML